MRSSILLFGPITVACPALSSAARGLDRILQIKRMPVFAYCLAGVSAIWSTSAGADLFFLGGQSAACATKSRTSFCYSGVLIGKFVSVVAVASGCVVRGWPNASQNVFSMGDGLKVLRVYAKRIATQVVYGFAVPERAVRLLPRPSVGAHLFARASKSEVSILPAVAALLSCRPNPALAKRGMYRPALVHFVPEPRFFFSKFCHNHNILQWGNHV